MSLIFPKDSSVGFSEEDVSKPVEKLCRLLESCYGPCGGDRLIRKADGSIVITNDGATFLSHLKISNPVAKMIVESSCRQDENAGDGTTGIVLLACQLVLNGLKAKEMGVSVPKVISGFERCQEICQRVIQAELSHQISASEVNYIERIISTSLSSKIIAPYSKLFQDILIKIFRSIASFRSLQFHRITIPNGDITASESIPGLVFEDSFSYSGAFFPTDVVNSPKIILLTTELEVKHQGISSRVQIDDLSKYHEFASVEWSVLYEVLDFIVESKCDIVISLKGIGDTATQFLARKNIVVIGRVNPNTFDSLSRMSDGMGQSHPLSESKCGTCKVYSTHVENGKRYHTFYSNSLFLVHTLVIRAPSDIIADEVNRSIDDSIGVLEKLKASSSPRILYGGGCFELDLCHYLRHSLAPTSGIPSVISGLFADSMEFLVSTLLKNAGFVVSLSLAFLKSERFKKWPSNLGVVCDGNGTGDVSLAYVWELATVREKALKTATEIACLLISVDAVILYPLDMTEEEKATEHERKIRERNIHGRKEKERQMATRGDIH